jgi:predicted metalloprotease with PDZ domain
MRRRLLAAWAAPLLLLCGQALASPGPQPAQASRPIPAPADKPYPGVIRLSVDASDVRRRVFRVHETIPVAGGGEVVLLYPQWLPGTHAPEGPIDRFAGLVISAGGQPVAWTRDPVQVYAFHVPVPKGAKTLEVDFTYLSPVSDAVGSTEISPEIAIVEWVSTVLYPAGYYTRQIQVEVELTLPAGWKASTALERKADAGVSATLHFQPTPLNTLGDSPVYAGRYQRTIELGDTGGAPVRLNLFADDPSDLDATPEQIGLHRALIQQGQKLYGSHHYAHYDFLLSLSDIIPGNGLEHHQSSEDSAAPGYFSDWSKTVSYRDLLAHEYTHSWNGKFRRGADLWTPNYNTPMRNSLLWVYEGQTEYWGKVLATRSGLFSKENGLDAIAAIAAGYGEGMPGRAWRDVRDTTNDEIINPRRPMSWRSWQRYEDYYNEGALVWLDADTLIRERSHGARSLDDFARTFFGVDDGSYVTRTYAFADVVKALNAVEPYDWATFLHARIDKAGVPVPLDGLKRGGYRLVFTDKPGALWESSETDRKTLNLTYSVGLSVAKDGAIKDVLWDGPAFKAGLATGMQILAVNGVAFDGDKLKAVIAAGKDKSGAIELIVKDQDRFRVVRIDYHGGLRYPHLERDGAGPASLDDILAAKK